MKLKRPLRGSETGADVRMVQRALNRAPSRTVITVNGIYGLTTKLRMRAFRRAHSLTDSPQLDQFGLDALWPYFDAYGRMRYRAFRPPKPAPTYHFPVARGSICQGIHETAGLPGNWAIDFCASDGAAVLAPEAGKIERLSGHDPRTAHPNPQGVYGWSVYLRTSAGYVYYLTHLGVRAPLAIGAAVKAGQVLGAVGNQQPYTGRPNHAHIGVTSPHGDADAKKRITAVSRGT